MHSGKIGIRFFATANYTMYIVPKRPRTLTYIIRKFIENNKEFVKICIINF